MSNVNNYAFSRCLDSFNAKVLQPQVKRVADALKIMADPNYKWDNDTQKQTGQKKLDNYKAWLDYYKEVYAQGMAIAQQHENLTNNLSKWYDRWYNDISNEGKQETEMMSMQADFLNEIFSEIYKELQPLNLEGTKPPQAMNL